MRVKDIVAQLEADTGFEPADSDIADRLGISLKKVRQLRAGSVPEIINQGDNDVEEELTNEGLLQDMVYADLDSRGKVIMEHLTGYNGAPVLPAKEIAKKLKISPAAVSQRLNTVRQLLAEAGVALSA
ncbi:MAG: sigma-70 domain-containing protein [Acholeplasmataceae bacterium]|jgi:DNA-directed RNA polymerase specialized sigma subunit